MEEQLSLKQTAEELTRVKGNSRGEIIRTHGLFISYKKGEEGLTAAEKKMAEIGYPLVFKDIKPLDWYPEALSVLVILVSREIFGWTEADVEEMGNNAPKYSLIVKMVMKYFFSLERCLKESPKYWDYHYDFGSIEVAGFDKKAQQVFIRINDYKFHPIVCVFYRGYFKRIAQLVISNQGIACEEVKSAFKGDVYHEYRISW